VSPVPTLLKQPIKRIPPREPLVLVAQAQADRSVSVLTVGPRDEREVQGNILWPLRVLDALWLRAQPVSSHLGDEEVAH
jgi:hypothetical protein